MCQSTHTVRLVIKNRFWIHLAPSHLHWDLIYSSSTWAILHLITNSHAPDICLQFEQITNLSIIKACIAIAMVLKSSDGYLPKTTIKQFQMIFNDYGRMAKTFKYNWNDSSIAWFENAIRAPRQVIKPNRRYPYASMRILSFHVSTETASQAAKGMCRLPEETATREWKSMAFQE